MKIVVLCIIIVQFLFKQRTHVNVYKKVNLLDKQVKKQ